MILSQDQTLKLKNQSPVALSDNQRTTSTRKPRIGSALFISSVVRLILGRALINVLSSFQRTRTRNGLPHRWSLFRRLSSGEPYKVIDLYCLCQCLGRLQWSALGCSLNLNLWLQIDSQDLSSDLQNNRSRRREEPQYSVIDSLTINLNATLVDEACGGRTRIG